MNLQPSIPTSASKDKLSLLDLEAENQGDNLQRSDTPLTKEYTQPKSIENAPNSFLHAPLSGPIRPVSPSGLSVLSADEYEQIGPGRRRSNNGGRIQALSSAPRHGWRGKLDRFWITNKGVVYMLIAQIFGTLMNVTTRLLEVEGNNGNGLHPFQILFARMGITVVLASGYMWYMKTPHFPLGMPEVRWLLVARGFGGFFGVFGMYYSLLYLPLADATVITFLAPGLACWACSILINEPFTRSEQIAGLVSLVGVVFIARPTSFFPSHSGVTPPASGDADFVPGVNATAPAGQGDASSYEDVTPEQRLFAVGIALVGVLGATSAFTTIRWIGKRAHPLISVNYFAAWCTLVSIVMQLAVTGFLLPSGIREWSLLFFLGICGFIMQFLLAAALAHEKSSRATNMTYTQMLFALTFDKMFFGHTPGWMSILGSSLILGAAIFVAVHKEGASNKENTEGSNTVVAPADEESQQGLIGGMQLNEDDDHHDTRRSDTPVQEIQLRNLR